MATSSYQMPNWMAQSFGLPQAQGRIPFPGGLAAPVAPVARPASNYDEAFAAALMGGGNNALNPEAIRRAGLLQVQRDAQLAIGSRNGREAVEQLKRKQWMEGTRSLADEEAGAVAPAYAGSAIPFNPNGVNNGIAYRNGQPVGFSGAVPGVASIPETGFNPAEQQAFRKTLWDRVAQSVQTPQKAVLVGNPNPAIAATAEYAPTRFGTTIQGLPDDTPGAAARSARMARGMPYNPLRAAMDSPQPPIEQFVPQGGNVTQRALDRQNTQAGLAAREQVKLIDKALPEILPQIAQEAGIAVDEDALASQILAEAEWLNGKREGKPPFINELGVNAYFEGRGIDPKVLVRWAQDRKKKKAA